jgi:8-oxo-dGTP pyrophosphatase MutT (NUDIX family)
MPRKVDIRKAGGALIRDRKLLVARSTGKSIFIMPGGKPDPGETIGQALVRELQEELNVVVDESDLVPFGVFYAPAAGQEGLWLQMDICLVERWQGEPAPSHEVDELQWVTSKPAVKIGSVIEHEVIPRLKAEGLID